MGTQKKEKLINKNWKYLNPKKRKTRAEQRKQTGLVQVLVLVQIQSRPSKNQTKKVVNESIWTAWSGGFLIKNQTRNENQVRQKRKEKKRIFRGGSLSRSVTNINFGKTETQEQEEESSFFCFCF